MRRVDGWECDELPVADGGEGTAEVLARSLGGEWRDGAGVGPARPAGDGALARCCRTGPRSSSRPQAVGLGLLAEDERDPLVASSAGLGELLLAVLVTGPAAVLVCVGGTATVDGGAGLRRGAAALAGRACRCASLCDVRNPLLGPRGAARVFGPQKGAGPEAVDELERRLAAMDELAPVPRPAGRRARAAGSAPRSPSLGGELREGAELVLAADRLRRARARRRRSPSPARARSTRRRSKARRRAPCSAAAATSACAASSSAAASPHVTSSAASSGDRAAQRRPEPALARATCGRAPRPKPSSPAEASAAAQIELSESRIPTSNSSAVRVGRERPYSSTSDCQAAVVGSRESASSTRSSTYFANAATAASGES